MEDWTFITLFVMAGVVYLILVSLIGRRWMSGRLSAALFTYDGRHSVNDEMRRLLARQSQRED